MIRRASLLISLVAFFALVPVSGSGALPIASAAGTCAGSSSATTGVYCASAGTLSQISPVSSPGAGTNRWADQWPSTDTVSGMGGTLSTISITLYDWTSKYDPENTNMLLVAPNGTAFEFFQSYNCPEYGTGVTDSAATITFSDTGTTFPASNCTALNGNTYKPEVEATGDIFPSTINNVGTSGATAGPGTISYTSPKTSAPTTLNGAFGGVSPNGTWGLYIDTMVANDCSGSVCESTTLGSPADSPWSLNINTVGATNFSTTTSLASNNNPSFTTSPGNSATLTATVTSAGGTVNAGTVGFTDNGSSIGGCSSQAVSNGTATCVTSFSAEGAHPIKATYSGGGGFNTSNGSLTQTVYHPTTANGTVYCNAGGATIPASGSSGLEPFAANPYPSDIFVGPAGQNGVPTNGGTPGLGGIIENVTLTLDGFSSNDEPFIGLLLVGPNGNAYDVMSYAGANSANPQTVTLADGASQLPHGSNFGTGTFAPASYISADSDSWPSPAPSSVDSAAPRGSATFATEFGGAGANGAWSLYAVARGSGFTGSLTGWCLNFTMEINGDATSTHVTSSGSPSNTGSGVTFTASVTDTTHTDVAVDAGTVDFTVDGNTIGGCGAQPVNAGVATCTTSALAEGIHTIGASYGGWPNGPTFGLSHDTLSQEVDNQTTETINGNTYTYCNPNSGGIQIPNVNQVQGAGYPYPSNIFVTHLPGTINHLTITIHGFSTNAPDLLRSLVVGPSKTAADSLDYFSNLNSTADVSNSTLTFDDSAVSQVTTPFSGTFKPTSAGGSSDSFPSPAPSGSYNYAASAGSSTIASVFGSGSSNTSTGNGTWSFYFLENGVNAGGTSITGSVCLNFTENPPVFKLSKGHSGTMTQGGSGTYSVSSGNLGPGPLGGTVTLTDTAPTGMTVTSMAGTGWTCTTPPTCTRADDAAQGTQFPTVTVDVSIAANAAVGVGALTNSVTISGGGAANLTKTDPTTILAATTTAVTSSEKPSTYGDPVSFTATVSAPHGPSTPTGSVQFYVNGDASTGTPLGSALSLNGSGQATSSSLATLDFDGSPHTVTAVYSGDAGDDVSTGTLDGGQTVNQAPLTLVCDNQSMTYGDPVPSPLTYHVTGAQNGDSNLTTGAGSCGTTATSASDVGNYTISADNGTLASTNDNYAINPTPTNGKLTVGRRDMSVTPATVVVDSTFTQSPALTGTITGQVNNDGITASYSTSGTPSSSPGTYDITSTLNDPNGKLGDYSVTQNTGSYVVAGATTNILTYTGPTTINGTIGSTVTLSASFTGSDGTTGIGSEPLTFVFAPYHHGDFRQACTGSTDGSGGASCQLSNLEPGLRWLEVFYPGGDSIPAQAIQLQINVNLAGITYTGPTTVNGGLQSTAFTAGFTAGGTGVSNEPLTFTFMPYAAHPMTCTNVNTDGSGNAECDLSNLPPGQHYLDISFAGDSNFIAEKVRSSITVNPGVMTYTGPTTIQGGVQPADFTASFTAGGAPIVGEAISFTFAPSSGAPLTCSNVNTNASGVATCTLSNLPTGPRVLVVSFAGDGSYKALPTQRISVNVVPATLTYTGPISIGDPAASNTFSATLFAGSTALQGDNVHFTYGPNSGHAGNCDATVQSDGSASCDMSNLPAGDRVLVVTFAGDGTYPAVKLNVQITGVTS